MDAMTPRQARRELAWMAAMMLLGFLAAAAMLLGLAYP